MRHMSDISLWFPASAIAASNHSAVSFASPDCSFLSFPRGTKSGLLKYTGCPTRMDPSAACTTSLLQNFPFSTSQRPNVKRFFFLESACFQTSSPPPAISSTATPMMPWYFCSVLLKTKTHGSKTHVSNPRPLAAARKQFLYSLVPSASPLTVLNSCTQTSRDSPGTPSGGIRTKSGRFRLIGSPVLNALYIPKLQLVSMAAHGLQDCHKALPGKCRRM